MKTVFTLTNRIHWHGLNRDTFTLRTVAYFRERANQARGREAIARAIQAVRIKNAAIPSH